MDGVGWGQRKGPEKSIAQRSDKHHRCDQRLWPDYRGPWLALRYLVNRLPAWFGRSAGHGPLLDKLVNGRHSARNWRRILDMEQTPFGPTSDEFAPNPQQRCATVLLLDVSGSMQGQPLAELQAGLNVLRDELYADDLVRKRVEIAVVTFGGTVDIVHNFTGVEYFQSPALVAKGDTPMGQAILMGLSLLNERKKEYHRNGILYFRPWVFLLTDGAPTDTQTPEWTQAVSMVRQGETDKKFIFHGFGVQDADMSRLAELSQRHYKLTGFKFRELFKWLSNSLGAVSRSTPGTKLLLPPPPYIEIET